MENIVNIRDNLRDAYKQAVPGTMRHVDELMNERRTNPIATDGDKIGDHWMYTADGVIYFIDGGIPKVAITREADNLVLRHIDEAFTQLTNGGIYHPNPDEAEAAIKSKDTEVFDLTKLQLHIPVDTYGTFDFSPLSHHELYRPGDDLCPNRLKMNGYGWDNISHEGHRLSQRVYGVNEGRDGGDFVKNMAMLKYAGVRTTGVMVLTPNYVREHAQNGPIAMTTGLSSTVNPFYETRGAIFTTCNAKIDEAFILRAARIKQEGE